MSDDIGSKVVETFIEGYEKVRKAIKENGISNMEVIGFCAIFMGGVAKEQPWINDIAVDFKEFVANHYDDVFSMTGENDNDEGEDE